MFKKIFGRSAITALAAIGLSMAAGTFAVTTVSSHLPELLPAQTTATPEAQSQEPDLALNPEVQKTDVAETPAAQTEDKDAAESDATEADSAQASETPEASGSGDGHNDGQVTAAASPEASESASPEASSSPEAEVDGSGSGSGH